MNVLLHHRGAISKLVGAKSRLYRPYKHSSHFCALWLTQPHFCGSTLQLSLISKACLFEFRKNVRHFCKNALSFGFTLTIIHICKQPWASCYKPLCAQANSASYPRREGKWVVAYGLQGKDLHVEWLIANDWDGGTSVVLHRESNCSLSVGTGWSHNAPRYH